jgi:S-methylmethionine-dependent homocysteine/selenocysteine methylase
MKLTDAGLETVLLFEEGIDLPQFAAFPLVDTDQGRKALRRYYASFIELARDRDVPLVLSAPTWRANPDWGSCSATRVRNSRPSLAARSPSSKLSATTRSGPRSAARSSSRVLSALAWTPNAQSA